MEQAWEEEEAVLGPWPSRCKRKDGQLLLTVNQLVHQPEDQSKPVVVDLREVVTRQMSPNAGGQAKAVVKLGIKALDKVETVFVELTSGSDRWAHQNILAKWMSAREEEAKKLEADIKREAELLGSRMDAILGCPELKDKFAYLVKQRQALTHDEFFTAHAQEISQRMPLPKAPVVDLSQLQPGRNAHLAEKKVSVSEEEPKAIFGELPELEKLYNAAVPTVMSPLMFWERCFASRYYQELMGHEVSSSHNPDPVFDALERSTPTTADAAAADKASIIDATVLRDAEVDLTGDFVKDAALMEPARPGKRGRSLAERLNERSASALEALIGSGAGSSAASTALPRLQAEAAQAAQAAGAAHAPAAEEASSVGQDPVQDLARTVERRREVLKRAANQLQGDLAQESHGPKAARLQMEPRACHGSALFATKVGATGDTDGSLTLDAASLQRLLTQWKTGVDRAEKKQGPTPSGTKWVAKEATAEILQAERLEHRGADGRREPPREVADVMTHAQSLLRHFWGSRWNQEAMRGRVVRELKLLLPILDRWEKETQSRSGEDALAKRAARSFAPPIRHALSAHETRFSQQRA